MFHRIFALAEQLEPDRTQVFQWLLNTRIPALDSLTPIELVFAGRGESVIELLESACRAAGGAGTPTCSAGVPAHQSSADPTTSRALP